MRQKTAAFPDQDDANPIHQHNDPNDIITMRNNSTAEDVQPHETQTKPL